MTGNWNVPTTQYLGSHQSCPNKILQNQKPKSNQPPVIKNIFFCLKYQTIYILSTCAWGIKTTPRTFAKISKLSSTSAKNIKIVPESWLENQFLCQKHCKNHQILFARNIKAIQVLESKLSKPPFACTRSIITTSQYLDTDKEYQLGTTKSQDRTNLLSICIITNLIRTQYFSTNLLSIWIQK